MIHFITPKKTEKLRKIWKKMRKTDKFSEYKKGASQRNV